MKKTSINWLKVRIFLSFSLFLLSFVLIFLRVVQLQVIEKESLQGLAERQHQRIIELLPTRGDIYDQNLGVLAKSTEIESLFAHPRQITNAAAVAKKLAPILEVKKSTIQKKLKSRKPFVWLQRKLPPDKAGRIRGFGYSGLGFLKENKRYYPNLSLAANLLGLVGVDSQGLEGLELQYDRYLKGQPKWLVLELDARGREIITETPISPVDLPSHSLVLTIDRHLQYIVKSALTQTITETRARAGMIVVMDPPTGRILAMESRPSFNPNLLKNYDPNSIRNRTIADVFEPGSIFKIFLLAAALEEGVVKRNDIFFGYNGAYQIGKEIIHDHKKYGWLTLQKVIKFSSNIGASQIGLKVGARKLDRHIRNFGFGDRTGIDLPGEVKGIVRAADTLSQVGIANTAFGQGISVTAVQLVSALSAIANGGLLMRPYIVDRIIDQKGHIVKSFHPEYRRRVISPETSAEVIRIMKEVVEPGGTGTEAAIPGYDVAGKTGTAQKIDPFLKIYSSDRYVSSFMGFVPTNNPRLAILVVLDEPKGTPYGGIIAAPVFKTVAQKSLHYLNVPPQQDVAHLGEPQGAMNTSRVQETALTASREPVDGIMPDLSGLSMRDALGWLQGKNLKFRFTGRGVVQEQVPRPGVRLQRGGVCYLKFAPLSS
jgi:cell division protein FtsI (penicillin-binding protein 3)